MDNITPLTHTGRTDLFNYSTHVKN